MSTVTAASVRTAVRSESIPDPHRWQALPVILAAMFMAMFDLFVVNVAATSLQHDLRASDASLQLIVGGYAFTYAAGLVTGGRLGDLYGHRHLYMTGMTLFALASLLCAVAATPGELIAARLLQGLTAAVMVPQVLALITTTFPAHERPRALAWFGATIGVGSIAGQVLGGALLQADLFGLGWRMIFIINVPIGAASALLAGWLLPKVRPTQRPYLDIVGAVGIAGSLALALVPLVLGHDERWPVWTLASMVASVPALAAVLRYEYVIGQRGRQPVFDLGLLRARSYSAGLVVTLTLSSAFQSFMFALTLLLQGGLGLSPLDAGLSYAPLGVAFALTSMAARPLVARFGPRVLTAGGLISLTGSAVLLAVLASAGAGVGVPELLPALILVGGGNGLVMTPLIGTALTGVAPERSGAAGGGLTTVQQFAGAAGIAGIGTIFYSVLGSHPTRGAYVSAMTATSAVAVGLMAFTAALTLLLPRPGARRHAR